MQKLYQEDGKMSDIVGCIICREWENERLTTKEAYRALGEQIGTAKTAEEKQHYMDLSDRILKKDLKEEDLDPGLDANWWSENHD
jgi:RNase H-fold protein (predicted Holliday junction resolvase)